MFGAALSAGGSDQGTRRPKRAEEEQRRLRVGRRLSGEFGLQRIAEFVAGVAGEIEAASGRRLHAFERRRDVFRRARDDDLLRLLEQQRLSVAAAVFENDVRPRRRVFLRQDGGAFGGVLHFWRGSQWNVMLHQPAPVMKRRVVAQPPIRFALAARAG